MVRFPVKGALLSPGAENRFGRRLFDPVGLNLLWWTWGSAIRLIFVWNYWGKSLLSFRLLWLLLSLFLVPVSAPAHAAITALFESPPSGPVSGVQVVRGWAFVTEPGDTIARVELVVDGAPAMTIPCCGCLLYTSDAADEL